jgi:hypothetical protein
MPPTRSRAFLRDFLVGDLVTFWRTTNTIEGRVVAINHREIDEIDVEVVRILPDCPSWWEVTIGHVYREQPLSSWRLVEEKEVWSWE